MPSIVPGFEYDIFVSYRHNDNAYDGWVTEFVERLRKELVATVKDKLTVYFDENAEDGLRESHQVGKSLEGKLKSLIFVPIISQTYCDTSAFAWNNEFKAFCDTSSADSFGRDIKLSNGNVASRILPIRIHDIESEDIRLLESTLSGVLRSIDFIYHAQGVNRPLRPKDDDLPDNLDGIIYRNQINKVANAVKEIIAGIKQNRALSSESAGAEQQTEAPGKITAKPHWFNTTVPSEIRAAVLDIEQPTVFLAWTSNDLKAKREEMAMVLSRAGFQVIPNYDCPSSDDGFESAVQSNLEQASCSLHILSGEFGRRFEEKDEESYPMFQFEKAREKSGAQGSQFQTFVWHIEEPGKAAKPQQQEFINNIRNYITANMTFTNAFSPMQLVEDMRALLIKEQQDELDTKDTDIFFIFNKQDAKDASTVTDLISKEYALEVMNILPGGEQQYRALSTQQIPRSKLAVIYFRYGADWALPFIKQVWKEVGGASSPTPMMLVGEDDPESNMARIFKAPKVISTVVPKSEVPEEVKKAYKKVKN